MVCDGDDPFGFRLVRVPPALYARTGRGSQSEADVFEAEQSPRPDWHAFALDRKGMLRFEPGMAKYHARLVKGRPVGAAGSFFVCDSGEVQLVDCSSRDYRIAVPDERHRTVEYVIDAFRDGPIRVADGAIFQFTRADQSRFRVSKDGILLKATDVRLFLGSSVARGVEDANATSVDPESTGHVEGDRLRKRRALG